MCSGEFNAGGNPAMDQQGEYRNIVSRFTLQKMVISASLLGQAARIRPRFYHQIHNLFHHLLIFYQTERISILKGRFVK